MTKSNRDIALTVAGVLLLISIVVAAFVNKMTSPRVMSDSELKLNGAYLFENPRAFDEIAFVDHNGQDFSQQSFQGKWSLVFFGFTSCPDVCPTTLAQLRQFYQRLEGGPYQQDTQVVLVTVDPARDSVEKLKAYIEYFHQDFVAVTGEFLALHQFASQLNIPFSKVPGGGENYLLEHGANIALVNPRGHYVGFFKAPLELTKLNASYGSIRKSHH
jgi:protein SCO1/2